MHFPAPYHTLATSKSLHNTYSAQTAIRLTYFSIIPTNTFTLGLHGIHHKMELFHKALHVLAIDFHNVAVKAVESKRSLHSLRD